MFKKDIIPKLPDAVFNSLPEEAQQNITQLRENGLAQQEEIKNQQRTLDRIFPTKEPDKVMFTTNCLCLGFIKFAMEAETDHEQEFILTEGYSFLKRFCLASYYYVG